MTFNDFEIWYKKRFNRTTSALTVAAMVLSDIAGVMLSFGAGFFFVNLYDPPAINFRSFVTYWPYLPVFIIIFWMLNLYPGIALAPAEELRHFNSGSAISFLGIIFSRFIENRAFDYISAAFFVSFLLSTFILLLCRSAMRLLLANTKFGGIPAVIYGGGDLAKKLIDKLLNKKDLSYIPVVILDDNAQVEEYRGVPVLRDTSLGPILVKKFHIKMAITAMPEAEDAKLKKIFQQSVSAFRYSVIIPHFFGATNIWMTVRDFNGILGFAATNKLRLPWNRFLKRAMDIILVFIGGLILLPFLLLTALLVKITSRGTALYGHERIGRYGKTFKAYKFRSMIQNADVVLKKMLDENPAARLEWEAAHKLKNDPRVTKFGSFLRKTSIDEFPQLINILKGEMSLVGPRPVVEDERKKYGDDFDRIFSVRPGLSGMWQISGRSDTDYAERISFDTYYLQSWSIWLDLWILYKTLGAVLIRKGAY